MKLTCLLGCTICIDNVEELSNRIICIDTSTVKGLYDLSSIYDTVEGSKYKFIGIRGFLSESGSPGMADYFPRSMMTLCLAEFIFRIPQSKCRHV